MVMTRIRRIQVRTTPLDPSRQHIFGWHPHGIIILSRVAVYGGAFKAMFPGIDMRGGRVVLWRLCVAG